MNPEDPIEERTRAAFAALRKDVTRVNTDEALDAATNRRTPKLLIPAVGFAAAAIVALGGFLLLRDGDGGTDVATPPDSTPVAPTSSATSTIPAEPVALPTPDGEYYPWIFPPPHMAWYEEGCPDPTDVATNFVANITKEYDIALEDRGTDADGRHTFFLPAKGEGGRPATGGSTITLGRIDPTIVDCEAWGVISVDAPEDVVISTPEPNATVGVLFGVNGEGRGFEATIDVRVIDDSYETVGSGFGTGGTTELAPFEAPMSVSEPTVDSNLILLAAPGFDADGALPPFTAVKVRFDMTLGDGMSPETEEGLRPRAVIGVATDDVLNVRSAPDPNAEIVDTLGWASLGVDITDETRSVESGSWRRLADPDRWVNEAFLTPVEGTSVPGGLFYPTVTSVRAGLSLDRPAGRLSDHLAFMSGHEIVVSPDGFIDPDDQRLTVDQLARADGATDDLRWGLEDGTGDPIEMSILEYFDQLARNPALTDTDRVSIDLRIGSGNTVDNLATAFPDATVVELHYSGDAENPEFTWSSVRLAFERDGDGWVLVAIASDSWTI